jgi:hypothetical protein
MTEDSSETDPELTRRALLAATGAAAVGAAGYATGRASAAPTDVYPVSGEDPLLKIRADRIVLIERTSDPSSPSDGTLWYNGSA